MLFWNWSSYGVRCGGSKMYIKLLCKCRIGWNQSAALGPFVGLKDRPVESIGSPKMREKKTVCCCFLLANDVEVTASPCFWSRWAMQNKRASPKAPGLGVKFSPAEKDLEAVRWSIAVAQFTRPDCPNGPAYLTLAMMMFHFIQNVETHGKKTCSTRTSYAISGFTFQSTLLLLGTISACLSLSSKSMLLHSQGTLQLANICGARFVEQKHLSRPPL